MTFSISKHRETETSPSSMVTCLLQKTKRDSGTVAKQSCKATVLLHSDMTGTYYEGTPLHNHPPHDERIKEMKHKNSMKTLATSAGNMDVTTRMIASNARENNETARRLSSDLRFIRRARQGNRTPRVPTDIVFDDESSAFVLYRTANNDDIVFGDVSLVTNATHASHISIDGTFGKCPNTHFQLLTCHAVCWNGHSFPFAFALLPNKSHSSYEKAFDEIDAAAMRTCHRQVFNRTDLTVLCNFEKGLLKALASLPCTVKGCYFHYTQAIWRFVAKHGFSSRYLTDADFRWHVRYLMVLPILPQSHPSNFLSTSSSCSE